MLHVAYFKNQLSKATRLATVLVGDVQHPGDSGVWGGGGEAERSWFMIEVVQQMKGFCDCLSFLNLELTIQVQPGCVTLGKVTC